MRFDISRNFCFSLKLVCSKKINLAELNLALQQNFAHPFPFDRYKFFSNTLDFSSRCVGIDAHYVQMWLKRRCCCIELHRLDPSDQRQIDFYVLTLVFSDTNEVF